MPIYIPISISIVTIGLVVATFLLNTGRGLNAIKVCKECFIFLNNDVLKTEIEIFNLLNTAIYIIIFKAYCVIHDYTKALSYGRQLLQNYRECGKTHNEGNLTVKLAKLCELQYKYVEARDLYKKAIEIMKGMGDRENEAHTYHKTGIMSYFIGDYDSATEHFEKGLAIKILTGDKNGEASSYGNLGTVFQSLGEYEKGFSRYSLAFSNSPRE